MATIHQLERVLQTANTCINQNTPDNDAGFQYWFQQVGQDELVCTNPSNVAWLDWTGTDLEQNFSNGMQYLAMATCIFNLCFYAYHYWKATTGWEEVYVVGVELVKVCLDLWYQQASPATLYLSSGNFVMWIRYAEWLLTCPVILIHLSNITGLKDEYSKRTMMLLVSDLGCIVLGVTAAMCYSWPKWIFFTLGMLYGLNTYFHATKVYIESYHLVPKGTCRRLVIAMAVCFFTAWTMFPILFIIGPEGMGFLSRWGSETAHTFADIMSKQVWGMLGHALRVKIFNHMKLHGTLSKSMKHNSVGVEGGKASMNLRQSQDSSIVSFVIPAGDDSDLTEEQRSMKASMKLKSGSWVANLPGKTWEDLKVDMVRGDSDVPASALALMDDMADWRFSFEQVLGWGGDEQVLARLRICVSPSLSQAAVSSVLQAVRALT